MELFASVAIFLFGTIIGSFLNVVIFRFSTGWGLGGRSMCLSCKRTLTWHELIPLVSFFSQGGRCRGCKSTISVQYPIVEAITGFVFLSLFLKFFLAVALPFVVSYYLTVFYVFVWSLMIVISVYDFRHQIIPDTLVWVVNSLLFVGLFFSTSTSSVNFAIPHLESIVAGPVIALPFFLLWYFSKGRALGFGDVKLAIGIGWMLGISGGIVAILFSFWIGALVAIVLMILAGSRFTLKTQIPFGPFLVTAAFIVFLFGINLGALLNFFGA